MNSATDKSPPPRPGGLTLRLFGGFEMQAAGRPLAPTRTRKEQWLLALLVLHGRQPLDRGRLAAMLWPESGETQARDNLRRSLCNLRVVLGGHANRLQSPTPRSVRFDLTGVDCDVAAFDSAIARGDPNSLREAAALYRGPLLEGCPEDWALLERASREQTYLTALERLATEAAERRATDDAVYYLRLLIAADPYRESAHRALMQALAERGDLGAATLVFRDLRVRLHDELRAEPAPETIALHRQLRAAARLQPSGAAPKDAGASAPSSARAHLPLPISELVGREREVAEIASGLAAARLVTLIGPGGIGKTRLAIAVAQASAGAFPDGIWFVDLAALSDGALVAQAVADRVGAREEAGRTLTETLARFLGLSTALLILDNCEHLRPACAALTAALLAACPNLGILATSRQPLGITGERIRNVPPLAVPALGERQAASLEQVLEADAVRLFVKRATEVFATFLASERNAEALARICRRLDGIPLAIELAAARARVLTVEQIAARLDDLFRLLTAGSSTALPRHQTLRACINWSFDLLSDPERALFRRLSVFADGWRLEAAEQVCSDRPQTTDDGPPTKAGSSVVCRPSSVVIEPDEILDLLSELVDRSLVVVNGAGSEARYRLLETIREYAHDKLVESEEADEVRGLHLAHYLQLAEAAGSRLMNPDEAFWLERLEAEHDNLRAALCFALEGPADDPSTLNPQPSTALRLCGALGTFWFVSGHVSEGRDWCRLALRQAESIGRTRAVAETLNVAGDLASLQGDHAVARAYLEASLSIHREMKDASGTAASLADLGILTREVGDYAAARAYHQESLCLYREIGDRPGIAASLANLGLIAENRTDYAAARDYYEESLAIRREIGDRVGIGSSLHGLGLVAYRQGDHATARRLYEEALPLFRNTGKQVGIAWLLNNLGSVARACGEYGDASGFYRESLSIFIEVGVLVGIAYSLEALAGLAVEESESKGDRSDAVIQRAARLLGAAQQLREEIGAPLPPIEQLERERLAGALDKFDSELVAAAVQAGRSKPLDEAVALALSKP